MAETLQIITTDEIQTVIGSLRKRRGLNAQTNLMIFRLSTFCGLRISEISGIELRDLCLDGSRPYLAIRGEIAKRKKSRNIPLWWSATMLEALREWRAKRLAEGATLTSPVVCSQARGTFGKRLSLRNIHSRWKHATKILGRERAGYLSCHCGRRTYATIWFEAGRSLKEIQSALGHSSIQTTGDYIAARDTEGVPDAFAYAA